MDLFGLRSTALHGLIEGTLTESQLLPSDIIALDETSEFYIGGFAISHTVSRKEKCKIATALIYAMLLMLKKRYLISRPAITLYSIGYSDAGRRWLKKMGFYLDIEERSIKNRHPVYTALIDRNGVGANLPKYRVAKYYAHIKIAD